MYGHHFCYWITIFALLLQGSVAQELQLPQTELQNQPEVTTAEVEMIGNNIVPTVAETEEQTISIDKEVEQPPSAMSQEQTTTSDNLEEQQQPASSVSAMPQEQAVTKDNLEEQQESVSPTKAVSLEQATTKHNLEEQQESVSPTKAMSQEEPSTNSNTTEQHEEARSPIATNTKAEMESAPTAAAMPTNAAITEESNSPDYQNDAAVEEPQVATATSAQPTTMTITVTTATAMAMATTTTTTMTTTTTIKAATVTDKSTTTSKHDCFTCSSYRNGTCLRHPTQQLNCPLMTNNRNGCYTLYKRDSKLIMRGCLSQLTEEDHKYCVKESKLCDLCYEILCNKQVAPNADAAPQLSTSFSLGLICIIATIISQL